MVLSKVTYISSDGGCTCSVGQDVAVLGSCLPSLSCVISHLHSCGGCCRSAQRESYSSAVCVIIDLSLSLLCVSSANSPIGLAGLGTSFLLFVGHLIWAKWGKRDKGFHAVEGDIPAFCLCVLHHGGTCLSASSDYAQQYISSELYCLPSFIRCFTPAPFLHSLLHTHLLTQLWHTDWLSQVRTHTTVLTRIASWHVTHIWHHKKYCISKYMSHNFRCIHTHYYLC